RLLWAAALVVVLIFNVRMAWTVNFDKYDDNSNSSGYGDGVGRELALKPYVVEDHINPIHRLFAARLRLVLRPYVDGLYGYVYAQTDRDIFKLVQAIKNGTDKLPSRYDTPIYVASPEYWPLPWYLRDYNGVAYSGGMPTGGPSQISQPIIIANVNQQSILAGMPGRRALPQAFTLRPGVELVIYVRDDTERQ